MKDLLNTRIYTNFVAVRVLGEGGMGVVFEAYNPETEKRVAIKVMKAGFAADPVLSGRFAQEARAPSKIKTSPDSDQQHENVAEVIDVGVLPDGRRFIVMEFLHGRNLEDLLADQLVGVEDAVSILLQTLSALDAAHRVGIIHRDLKPENIFLVYRPALAHVGLMPDFVKLLDFGIAKLADPIKSTGVQTSPGLVMGTPQYMSPEQVERPTHVDRRSDIYAVGCIIYRIFAGRPPFLGSLVDICIAQRSEIMPPPLTSIRPDLDPRWDRIVWRCLRYAPEARYHDVKELGSDIIAAAGERGQRICEVAWPRLSASPNSKTYRNPGTFPTPPPLAPPPAPLSAPNTTLASSAAAIEASGTATVARDRRVWIGVGAAFAVAAVLVAVAISRAGGDGGGGERPAAGGAPSLDAASAPAELAAPRPARQQAPAAGATEVPPAGALVAPASTAAPVATELPTAGTAGTAGATGAKPARPVPETEFPSHSGKKPAARGKARNRSARPASKSPTTDPPAEPTPTSKPPKRRTPFDPNGVIGQ